jgi:hypothetical protein
VRSKGIIKLKYVKWFLLIALATAFLTRQHLPCSWSWEDGPVENAQVIILAVGMVLSLWWGYKAKAVKHIAFARFWIWMALGWLILVGRELSWGRVLFVMNPGSHEPAFISLHDLKFGFIIRLLPIILMLLWVFGLIRSKFYRIPFQLVRERRFPVSEFAITLLAVVLMNLAEGIINSQIMEETTEAIMYLSLIVVVIQAKLTKADLVQPRSVIKPG